jgi:membrane protease YdiL (CAAX protease family)
VGDGRGALGAGLVVGDLILVACVLAVAARGADRLGGFTLGIRRTEWGPAIGWGAALLVSGIAVQGLLGAAFGAEGGGDSSTVRFSAGAAVLVTLGVAVTAPIAEEVAFRGYLFPALTRWRGPWMAATVTALLFGAAHFAALPAALLPGAAFFGFGACLLFWFTGSLLPCVAVHSVNNALVLAIVTGGQLAPAILLAPALSLLVLWPFVRERAATGNTPMQSTVSSTT